MPIDKTKLQRRKEVCQALKEKLAENLDLSYSPDDLSDDVSLIGSGLGLDSLDILEIVLCVENNFSIKMPEDGTHILRSLNTLADFIIQEQDKQCTN
ncbi:MAG: hypothetical protein IJF70_01705 [Opitutales bacterium]|nr:hypothetical protein [Opitutales bacterium]